MADQSVPTKNQAYILATSLVSQADANIFQNLPTLAAGDARLNTYNGAVWSGWGNTTNAPAQNGERAVIITLTAAEMNNDIVHVVFNDAAGAEWQDQAWILHPTDSPLADIAGDVWDEARVGHAGAGSFGEGAASVQGNVTGSVGSVTGNVGGNVTGSVGSMGAGGIAAASFAAGAVDAAALAADAANEIADATLGRNLATVAGAAGRSLLNAVRFLRNRWQIGAGVLTVYEEDDVTPAWTGAVSTAVSNPVDEIDPV